MLAARLRDADARLMLAGICRRCFFFLCRAAVICARYLPSRDADGYLRLPLFDTIRHALP